MNKDQIFSDLIKKLAQRSEYVGNQMNGGIDSGYMQSLVYNMMHEVPGVAEYVKTYVEHLTKLHQMEEEFNT